MSEIVEDYGSNNSRLGTSQKDLNLVAIKSKVAVLSQSQVYGNSYLKGPK